MCKSEATDSELHLWTPGSTCRYQVRPEEMRVSTAEIH